MSTPISVKDRIWRMGAKAGALLQRILAGIGARHPESRISADSQQYWREPGGARWKADSHWRDASVLAEDNLWWQIGHRHLTMFERGARMVEFTRP
ncbi:MAG: hypothetical protein ACRDQ7_06750 [Haloechinothrix sp.]